MSELASSTVSPSVMRMTWSRLAMRDSAAIGSPCEPVQTRQTLCAGIFSSCFMSTTSPSGTSR
jgi:hypothetical protein